MLNKIKNWLNKPKTLHTEKPEHTGKNQKQPRKKVTLTPKELATQNDEPYIAITNIDINPNDINTGELTFDWNDKFILNLIRAGYKIKDTDTEWDMVNRWYQTLCRNVALEIYEQYEADPNNRNNDVRIVKSRDIGNGRSEIS